MKYEIIKLTKSIKILFLICTLGAGIFAQSTEPKPAAPKSVKIPAVKEFTLKNGLKVAVVERPGVPLVSAMLMVKTGAEMEDEEKAGLADMTASLLTKGTKTRSATEIAEALDFLGADLDAGANWKSSGVSMNIMSDKLDKGLELMSDAVLNPAFKESEIELLRSQTLDGLSYNLTQPGFLANYVASVYSFNKHPAGGTIESITNIKRNDIVDFYKSFFIADNSVLIFTGDITAANAKELAQKYFGKMGNDNGINEITESSLPGITNIMESPESVESRKKEDAKAPLLNRILVVDLPNSGQAAVSFARNMQHNGRIYWDDKKNGGVVSKTYFPAIVMNSLLGGGYSSRLNQEIRIKRGLSYGAGSSFNWQYYSSDFGTRTQTKNESAAEVAELVTTELKKLSEGEIPENELNPRRMVLTGSFGRNLETNEGLTSALGELYAFELSPDNLNSYMNGVMKVTDKDVKKFAAENFNGGDIIIVGDYSIFKDDLAKRFPKIPVTVVRADELDITKEDLRKK